MAPSPSRIIIVGGPRTGKSTIAREYRASGIPTLCGDPRSKAKDIEDGVEYLPEGLDWSGGSQYVADHWFAKQGPWVCEGQIMARALRKWMKSHPRKMPADQIIVITDHHPKAMWILPGQRFMHKSVMTVWSGIRSHFDSIARYKTNGSSPSPRASSQSLRFRRGKFR